MVVRLAAEAAGHDGRAPDAVGLAGRAAVLEQQLDALDVAALAGGQQRRRAVLVPHQVSRDRLAVVQTLERRAGRLRLGRARGEA